MASALSTDAVVFEPLDFIARLAALVPRPWMNMSRIHGVFAPNSKHRKAVTGYNKSSAGEPSATLLYVKIAFKPSQNTSTLISTQIL